VRLSVSIFTLDEILEIKAADSSETPVLNYLTNAVSYGKTVIFRIYLCEKFDPEVLTNEECWNLRLTVMWSKLSAL